MLRIERKAMNWSWYWQLFLHMYVNAQEGCGIIEQIMCNI